MGGCQTEAKPTAVADPCLNRAYQAKLIERYIEKGAQRYGYNHPNWEVYCDSLIAACPNVAVGYQEKAIPYLKNGDYARAFALEDKAVSLDPKTWTAYRGFLYCIFTKDYPAALRDFEQAEKLVPGGYQMDHTYWFYRGLCNLELGDLKAAEADLLRDVAAQQQGNASTAAHFNSLFYLGVVAYEAKQLPKAADYLRQALQQYPQHPDAHYYLGLTEQAMGKANSAQQHLAQARQYLQQGYSMSEDNLFYANYPHQITAYEVAQALTAK
ncbi:hypothetical protein ASU33_06495 [Solirubrum puertoriconensis]|uniref:Tetratricopeptide repeat protein n=1 Tax=Solirubrum puertoriconensis TaxID=1751427 RepID=A0A9X0L3W8_SOLP1|nr:hypothetical protein ASU33_06495 [Solirubrum puertoriconensis]